MSLNDELNQISSDAAKSDDVSQLSDYQKRCEAILANVTTTLAAEQDEELRSHLTEVKQTAENTLREVKQRLADVKVARLDPQYEQRKAQKQREAELKKQQDQERAQQFFPRVASAKYLAACSADWQAQGPPGWACLPPARDKAQLLRSLLRLQVRRPRVPTGSKCGQCGAEA